MTLDRHCPALRACTAESLLRPDAIETQNDIWNKARFAEKGEEKGISGDIPDHGGGCGPCTPAVFNRASLCQ